MQTAYLISRGKMRSTEKRATMRNEVSSLLDIDIRSIIERIEVACNIRLPRSVREVYLDPKTKLLHIRFQEPKRIETGEPLSLKSVVTLFRDEDTDSITAIEILDVEELLRELLSWDPLVR